MCNKAVVFNPYPLRFVPDHLKTKEMCNNKAVTFSPSNLRHALDYFKTQEKCNEAVAFNACLLNNVPYRFKTQRICEWVANKSPCALEFVPDWFVTQQQIKSWHDDDDYCDDSRLIKWYRGYKKRKAQKAKIIEELMFIAWHPNCVMDWCMSEDEKGWWK